MTEDAQTTYSNAPAQEITLDSLARTAKELYETHPLIGYQVVISPFLPPNVSLLDGPNEIALMYHDTGKIVCLTKPPFPHRKPPLMPDPEIPGGKKTPR